MPIISGSKIFLSTLMVMIELLYFAICAKKLITEIVENQNKDMGFISKGFTDWHHAVEKFKKHQNAGCHSKSYQNGQN